MDVSQAFYWNCVRNWYCNQTQFEPDPGCAHGQIINNSIILGMCDADVGCDCVAPVSYIDGSVLVDYWTVINYLALLMTWVVLPLMQSFMTAGDFTVWDKTKTSLKENGILYGSVGVLAAGFLIYIIVKDNLTAATLQVLLIAASNTWGLLLLGLMMGYGVVDLPRTLWRYHNRTSTMHAYEVRIAKLHGELGEAREKLEETIDEVRTIAAEVFDSHSLRPFVNLIILKCPLTYDISMEGAKHAKDTKVTKKSLAALHYKLKVHMRVLRRCECLLDEAMNKAMDLEDVIANEGSKTRRFRAVLSTPYDGCLADLVNHILWYWKLKCIPAIYFSAALISTIMSVILLWSEVLFFIEVPILSIFAQIMLALGVSENFVGVELLTFLSLLYMGMCAYRVIFRLRIFNWYYMVPGKQTDTFSLLFAAVNLSRLTSPLCLNFLSMTHLDSQVTPQTPMHQDTNFTHVMGHLSVLPFMAKFAQYYPMVMIGVSVSTLLSLASRCLRLVGLSELLENDSQKEDYRLEGRSLINREKRHRQRKVADDATDRTAAPTKARYASTIQSTTAAADDDDDDDDDTDSQLSQVLVDGVTTKVKGHAVVSYSRPEPKGKNVPSTSQPKAVAKPHMTTRESFSKLFGLKDKKSTKGAYSRLDNADEPRVPSRPPSTAPSRPPSTAPSRPLSTPSRPAPASKPSRARDIDDDL